MAVGKFLLFFGVVAIALGVGSTPPRAADETDCYGSPGEAVRILPAPLRKWGHIACTRFGHMLESREGWVWAWLDGSGSVAIPSQMVKHDPMQLGNESYFVTIDVADLEPKALVFALSVFHDALNMDEGQVKGYRVNLRSVSGDTATIYFLDFEKFVGGMWCPDDACVPQSRFMIMERDHGADLRAASV
jgi:hypothetical protein